MTLPVVIITGGLGTRLGQKTSNKAKALIDVAGKPFISRQLNYLYEQGIKEVVLCIAHFGEQIKDYILLEIPLNPICNKSCAGLCIICGENLNTRKCECKKETFDPRWEALQDLKTN